MGVVMVSTGLGAGVLQARHEKWEWKIVIGSRSLSRTFTGCLRPALLNPNCLLGFIAPARCRIQS